MFKTIIFDLGGVYFTDGSGKAIETISRQYRVEKEKVREILLGELSLRYRKDEITVDEFWNKAKKELEINEDNNKLNQIWIESYQPIEETVTIVKKLRKAGFEVLFLSNNVKERADYLDEKYHFTQDFDGGVHSYLVKVNKPDSKIYEAVLAKASHPKENCLFIDDKQKFVDGAEKIGLKGVVFTSPEQLETDLRTLGVTP